VSSTAKQEPIRVGISADSNVSGVVGVPEWWPTGSRVGVVIAHDVEGGMDAEVVTMLQRSLSDAGYLAMRFNFPFAEQRRKRPDPLPLLERAFRAAAGTIMYDPQNAPTRLIAAGFGLGARVAVEAVRQGLKVDALVCLGYPLHPAGKPAQLRADALFRIICPILFVQGTRDATCRIDRMQTVLRRVGAPTRLLAIEDADHDFAAVPRSERTTEQVRAELLAAVEGFCARMKSSV
jgi:hypothetical protein